MNQFNNQQHVGNQAGRAINISMLSTSSCNVLLRPLTAPQAAFNAQGKDNDPQCLRDTRVQVLEQIRTWVENQDDERYIFWLSGWAGTGKSTIARTIAREYYDQNCFTASFFFSRGGGDVSHAGEFVGAVASELSSRCADFKSLSPSLIVLDALNECDERDVGLVLQPLRGFQNLGQLRPRIFITSRPEIPVQHGFERIPGEAHRDFMLHDIEHFIVEDDIRKYLQHALSDTQQKHKLEKNWPGEEAIDHLAQKASGSVDPTEELNQIYIRVLGSSVGPSLKPHESEKTCKSLSRVLGVIATLFSPLPAPSISQILKMPEQKLYGLLSGLHPFNLGYPKRSSPASPPSPPILPRLRPQQNQVPRHKICGEQGSGTR
ncbi:hypothetical protein ACJ73_09437 [Blastomyces percursus]|uniref:Nephrocystin 3-like N-terminal domain-containing protein n=1 Tax=Blastomyces percursus TaxID=1658174 RepID=A0A1J9Q6S3_9EURO|nr:hypothetical protein ACJ73_09437 [Blastomyces percursus]